MLETVQQMNELIDRRTDGRTDKQFNLEKLSLYVKNIWPNMDDIDFVKILLNIYVFF